MCNAGNTPPGQASTSTLPLLPPPGRRIMSSGVFEVSAYDVHVPLNHESMMNMMTFTDTYHSFVSSPVKHSLPDMWLTCSLHYIICFMMARQRSSGKNLRARSKYFWILLPPLLFLTSNNTFANTVRIPEDSELCFFDVEEFREANNHLAFYERQRYEIAIPGIDARGQLPCRLKLMYEDAGEELLPFDSDKESDHQGEWYIHRQSDEYYYLYFNGSDPEYYNLDSNSTGPKSGRYHVIGRNGKHFNTECSTC